MATDQHTQQLASSAANANDTAAIDQAGQGDSILPLTLCGPEISYFTGKLESVLRYMELPYQRVTKGPMGELAIATGTAQVPALKLADNRWLTDSTPIIDWLDQRYPKFAVIPQDPLTAFFSRLLEDYADEWLWRPAMHYRWDYAEGAAHQGRVLADAHMGKLRAPGFIMRYLIRNRQRKYFTKGDGVTADTWDHVEKIFHNTLDQFNTILETRPYLLGTRPSLADFGFFGPMFRHFAMDPTSARIMRETAPAVFEWVARVWNARASATDGELLDYVPDDWGPILDSIGSAYLPYLCANADAWKAGSPRFDVDIEGAPYRDVRTAPYRVWCLEELRRRFNELSEAHQKEVHARLEAHGCWTPLWQNKDLMSGVNQKDKAPFAEPDLVGGSGSMTGVSPLDAEKIHWLPVFAPRRYK
jgi:glutathione S-transferase